MPVCSSQCCISTKSEKYAPTPLAAPPAASCCSETCCVLSTAVIAVTTWLGGVSSSTSWMASLTVAFFMTPSTIVGMSPVPMKSARRKALTCSLFEKGAVITYEKRRMPGNAHSSATRSGSMASALRAPLAAPARIPTITTDEPRSIRSHSRQPSQKTRTSIPDRRSSCFVWWKRSPASRVAVARTEVSIAKTMMMGATSSVVFAPASAPAMLSATDGSLPTRAVSSRPGAAVWMSAWSSSDTKTGREWG
mmetsp:Transcript_15222/g.38116  ORF Transcript_15222/g.38116 Transcript_15222/m.38116 type:complete len:250 (+) Transcript_15222:749-1498(+)